MADLRIRVRLPTNLLAQLNVVAASNNISLNRLIEHILREYLLRIPLEHRP